MTRSSSCRPSQNKTHTVKKAMHLQVFIHQCKYSSSDLLHSWHHHISSCINHFHVFTGKQRKMTQENVSSSAARTKRVAVEMSKYRANLVIFSRLSSKALLEFKYRHVVGLVGLCNRIFHTMVYRLLLFYIGNEMCIFNCPEGSGIPRYIIACVTIQL